MGFLEFTGLDKVLPTALGGKPKMDLPAMTAQNFQPAPLPQAPPSGGMGQLGGRHRRRSHKRRAHRKTKKHSRR